MKEEMNMKKWWITLAALVLLLIPSVAMAGNEIGFYCFNCRADRTGIKSDTYEYSDQYAHIQRIICKECNYKGMSIRSAHTETIAATCQSPAYCALCKSYYGNPNPDNHNWSEWQPHMFSPNLHYRYCQNPGCSASESEAHDGNSNCVTSATCSKCHTIYTDTTNHKGPLTYTYEKEDETFHKKIEICTACGKRTGSFVSTKHVEKSPATCTAAAYCAVCESSYGDRDPNTHVGDATTTYTKSSETEHTPTTTYSGCQHSVTGKPEAHTESTAATCTTAAYCNVCKSSYGDPDLDAHDLVQYEAQAPTCFHVGWNAYEACQNEGCGYTTYEEIPRLVHWYAEWMPNADATHTASCKRGCRYQKAVSCTPITIALPTGDEHAEITLCPVCGEVSDGTRLMLTEAAATAVTGKLPAGEVVVRMGTLESGETIVSIAFEIGGKLTQPDGQVCITLPAELLAGYTLSLLSEDGAEAPIESVIEEDIASFTLDFTESQTPSRLLRLVPQA